MKAKIQTLLKQLSSGNFNSQSSKILRYVGSNDKCTIDMMRKDLKLAHQSLTGRISDLEDLGMLYVERGLNEFLELLKSDEDFLELIAKGEIKSQLNLFP